MSRTIARFGGWLVIAALARPAQAADASVDVTVQLLDDKGKPARGADLLLCEANSPKCHAAATTGAKGQATFKAAPRRALAFLLHTGTCGPTKWDADLRTVDPKKPIVLQMEATSTLRVRPLETSPDGKGKPILSRTARISLFPKPPLPNGDGMRTYQFQDRGVGYYDICIPPDSGWDVQIDVDGYYRGSTHVDAVRRSKTEEASVLVRAKPKP